MLQLKEKAKKKEGVSLLPSIIIPQKPPGLQVKSSSHSESKNSGFQPVRKVSPKKAEPKASPPPPGLGLVENGSKDHEFKPTLNGDKILRSYRNHQRQEPADEDINPPLPSPPKLPKKEEQEKPPKKKAKAAAGSAEIFVQNGLSPDRTPTLEELNRLAANNTKSQHDDQFAMLFGDIEKCAPGGEEEGTLNLTVHGCAVVIREGKPKDKLLVKLKVAGEEVELDRYDARHKLDPFDARALVRYAEKLDQDRKKNDELWRKDPNWHLVKEKLFLLKDGNKVTVDELEDARYFDIQTRQQRMKSTMSTPPKLGSSANQSTSSSILGSDYKASPKSARRPRADSEEESPRKKVKRDDSTSHFFDHVTVANTIRTTIPSRPSAQPQAHPKVEEPALPLPPGLQESFVSTFAIPHYITKPKTKKQHQLILKTAEYIRKNGLEAEIELTVKQANNPKFSFLFKHGTLNPYFEFLKRGEHENKLSTRERFLKKSKEIQRQLEEKKRSQDGTSGLGLGGYGSSSEEENSGEENQKPRPLVGSIKSDTFEGHVPSPQIKQIVKKLAVRVAHYGRVFEEKIRKSKKDDPKFKFLQSFNKHHSYYLWVLDKAVKSQLNNLRAQASKKHKLVKKKGLASSKRSSAVKESSKSKKSSRKKKKRSPSSSSSSSDFQRDATRSSARRKKKRRRR